MSYNNIHVGSCLRILVKDRGVKQVDLAEKLGVSQPSVTKYFNTQSPSFDTISKICDACGVPTWQFIYNIETGRPINFIDALDAIFELEQAAREYVLKRLSEEVQFICKLSEKND